MSVGTPSTRERERLFSLVADRLPLLVWISGLDRRCTYFNKSWLDFTGRPLESEIGDAWANGVHAADRQHRLDTHARAFDHREPFIIDTGFGGMTANTAGSSTIRRRCSMPTVRSRGTSARAST